MTPDLRSISHDSQRSTFNTKLSKWKHPDPKVCTSCDFIYMESEKNGKSIGTTRSMMVWGGGWKCHSIPWLHWWLHDCIYFSELFKLYIQRVNFTVCTLCLNKPNCYDLTFSRKYFTSNFNCAAGEWAHKEEATMGKWGWKDCFRISCLLLKEADTPFPDFAWLFLYYQ